jgi:hypothetical protein
MNSAKNDYGFMTYFDRLKNRMGSYRRVETKIPVELCFYVLKKKWLPSFKVYILLKLTCSGKRFLTLYDKKVFSEFCGYASIRAFENHVKNLLELNWIGYNRETKIYHIRGFEFIQNQLGLRSRTGFWFSFHQIRLFDGIVYGAIIGYLCKSQEKKQRIDPKKGRSNQVLCKTPGYYPIANRALAKILNISISTASMMKRRAVQAQSIKVMRKRIVAPATHDIYKEFLENIPTEYLNPIIWKDGFFYQRFPDLIKAELKYGKRKKSINKKRYYHR